MTEFEPGDRPSDPESGNEPRNFTEWARAKYPHLSEVSNSNPNAVLLAHNLVAITDEPQIARAIALDFERTTTDGFDTTLLVLGHAEVREDHHQADPEGVTAHAAKLSLLGGIPGAVIGALVIGLGVFLLTRSPAATFGAVLGGAFFGFFAAAMVSFVIGTGQSEAYQQSFIDPDAADAILVAIHADDRAVIDAARGAVSSDEHVKLLDVDASGDPSPTA